MNIKAIAALIIGVLAFCFAVYGNLNNEKIAKSFGSFTRNISLFGYSTSDPWNVSIFRSVFIFLTIFGILLMFVGIRDLFF